jgi:hypothetical protein
VLSSKENAQMNETVEQSIKEEMAKLPKPNQQAINAFDWRRKCQESAIDIISWMQKYLASKLKSS